MNECDLSIGAISNDLNKPDPVFKVRSFFDTKYIINRIYG